MSLRLFGSPRRRQEEQQQPPHSWVEARPITKRRSPLKKLPKLWKREATLGPETSLSPRSSHQKKMTLVETQDPTLHWMESTCPSDLLPKILSFAGPQTLLTLTQANKKWNRMVDTEAVWRTLCEDQGKWTEGNVIPNSWKEYYKYNPCVPIDYSTIPAALAVASDLDEDRNFDVSNVNPRVREQRRSIRILLRPGRYVVRKSLVIHGVGNAHVTIETLPGVSGNLFYLDDDRTLATQPPVSPRRQNLRDMWSCRYSNSVLEDVHMQDVITDFVPSEALPMQQATLPPVVNQTPPKAMIVMKTRRHNEPIFRVRQGSLTVKNVELIHNCNGMDIWNGNSAIQIQPPLQRDVPVPTNPRPTVSLEGTEVVSKSGRGVVTIDGGSLNCDSCWIHDCAATGIYVGGPGSKATILKTDVVENGNGNRQRRNAVQRGHSGIYLEQGLCEVSDSNISKNSLTGISAVSPENSILNLTGSSLIANGTVQLELPPNGSLSRRRSLSQGNVIAREGLVRSRSGLGE